MHWHTVRYDERAKRVEVYRHADDMFDGDPVILIDAGLDKFGPSVDAAEQLATWIGRIVLSDNPAVRKALGLG
ncbi:MAG TPA: hypothetical protein VFV70_02360 [Hyphomonadaceae bacterium]|nr:hypothetical protein [Hyphomonadaceae bacterium]